METGASKNDNNKTETPLAGPDGDRWWCAGRVGQKEGDMTTKSLKSAIWLTLAASTVALAAGPPPGKGPGGHEEDGSNNLSVPAILVGGSLSAAAGCGSEYTFGGLVEPTGTPGSNFPIDPSAFYFVQGVHEWQAECTAVTGPVSVRGEWGDNLTGDAKLKANKPIRVELLIFHDSTTSAQGYEVVKLEPDTLDRLSTYGTLATPDGQGGHFGTAQDMTPIVYDGGASMTIEGLDNDFVVTESPAVPEINATGKVVYGYNLRVPQPGNYRITFTMPNVSFTGGCDAGTCSDTTATLEITVGTGGGGGKGRTK